MKFKPMGAASMIQSKADERSAQKPNPQQPTFASTGGGGGGK